MKMQNLFSRGLILVFLLLAPNSRVKSSGNFTETIISREIVIEDFDSGSIELQSYPGEDEDPLDWELNSTTTYQNSPWSLKLFGNTWKVEEIQSAAVDSGDVWQVSVFIQSVAEIQGFGIMDSANVLFYSFAGNQQLNGQTWIPVYQGCFPNNQWNNFQLPIADDWLATYDYLPKITSLVFVNDKDDTSQGIIFFDEIFDITEDLPIEPEVSIEYSFGNEKGQNRSKSVEVQFVSEVVDPDSNEHEYFWDFGDGFTSSEPNPLHTFSISDDHPYTVLLKVSDETQKWGWASCRVAVSAGVSSFPVTLNFVGDIMLAREYEYPGGIIPTQGVEAIFEPTKPFLGDVADFTVANLECPLTTWWAHHPTKPIYFKGSPENVAGLVFAGIDLVTLANNHTMDYLLPGMQETQEVLEEKSIKFSGAGENAYQAGLPAFYSKSGINFAFLAASDRTGQYNNQQPYLDAGFNKPGFLNLSNYQIKKQISEVENVSDFVVMEFHSGSEYSFTPETNADSLLPFAGDFDAEEDYSPVSDAPTDWNREIRHFAIDNGADLVICHHPHIIHGVELYNGKLIAHSLGNFTFDLVYPETFPSMILNSKVNEAGFYDFSITPVYIDDFIPQRANGELGLHILDYLAQRSKELDTYLKVDRENVLATVIMDTTNMVTSEAGTTAELILHPENGSWETPPFRIEKTGSISSINKIQPPGFFQYRLGRENIWFGNMEDEGCTLWYLNNSNEVYCDTIAFKGQRSLQHKREDNSPYNLVTNFEHRIICRSDTSDYSLCGYIKTLNGAGVTIEVQYFQDQEGGIQLGQQNIGTLINGDTPWTFYHRNLTIPTGTEFFDIRLISDVPGSGTAFSWFDNVSLVCWENWMESENSPAIPCPNDYYFLQIKSDQSLNEITINYSETVFDASTVGFGKSTNTINLICELQQNSPNPFNPETGSTNIAFNIGKPGNVKLVVYDFMGRQVKVLTDTFYPSGSHRLAWDGTNSRGEIAGSGVYFYKIEFQNQQQVKKCVLLHF